MDNSQFIIISHAIRNNPTNMKKYGDRCTILTLQLYKYHYTSVTVVYLISLSHLSGTARWNK